MLLILSVPKCSSVELSISHGKPEQDNYLLNQFLAMLDLKELKTQKQQNLKKKYPFQSLFFRSEKPESLQVPNQPYSTTSQQIYEEHKSS